MLKTKISQTHVTNLTKFQQKLQQLYKIQTQMYQRIKQNQRHAMSQIQQSKQSRNKCLKQRPNNIKAQTFQQIIKHPVNGDQKGGNGCWMYLANFIQQRHDLSDVQKRIIQRKQIRDGLQKIKRQDKQREQMRLKKQRQQKQWRQGLFDSKGIKKGRGVQGKGKGKIPFSLQRQLHRKQVDQNRKRIQKMQQYKKETYYRNNNY